MIVAFDVNETLLDLSVLDDPFKEAFGSDAVRRAWFTQMLQLSFVGGLTGAYVSGRHSTPFCGQDAQATTPG